MHNRFQEKEEGKVSLDKEDPEAVALALRFIYEQDYSVPEKTKQPYSTPGINITWSWSSESWLNVINRNLRGRNQHGLTHVNQSTMTQAITLVQGAGLGLIVSRTKSTMIR
jgi:hypothetical protein